MLPLPSMIFYFPFMPFGIVVYGVMGLGVMGALFGEWFSFLWLLSFLLVVFHFGVVESG
jgi:hypothetical protein